MTEIKNVMEIYQHLEKSNCKKCNEPTCLAFAAAVFKGQKSLKECPHLDDRIVAQYSETNHPAPTLEQDLGKKVAALKEKVSGIDFSASKNRLDAELFGEKLAIRCLGKLFYVAPNGDVTSDTHIHPWVTIPILNYVLFCKKEPTNTEWTPLRELKDGAAYAPLFEIRSEKPIKKIADTHTSLFEDLIRLFNGKPGGQYEGSDISLVLHPLPKIPMLICYWKPEDGLDSALHIFFDKTAEENLNIDSVYMLGAGISRMIEKLTSRHGIAL
jgi:uncharacterized protein DUF3786/putative Fe-S cluster protein